MNRMARRLIAVFFACTVVYLAYAQTAQQEAKKVRPPQAKTSLLIRADIACEFSIDGQPLGWVKPDGVKLVPVGPGDHLVSGVNKRGHKWEKVVTVKDSGQQVVLAECSGPVPPDLRELINKADAGDPKSQFSLAYIYEQGAVGVQQDDAEAMYWYRAAAEQGHLGAELALAAKYAEGKLALRDYAEAAKWYRKAAEQKSPRAYLELGKLYENGLGVDSNGAEALRWYRMAADAPPPASSNVLSAEQSAKIFDFYVRAEAQYRIGSLLYDGEGGVKQDVTEAASWFRLAAKLGHKWCPNGTGAYV